jgi:hypothetical protein
MRLIAFTLALFATGTLAASGPAAAQSWQEYSYPEYAFRVSFPAQPKVETTTYQAPDGRAVPAQVYSAAQGNGEFKMTVADLSSAAPEESAVIDQAIKTLSQGGEVKVNIPARVMRVFGRQLSILGADGSRSSVALFYYEGRLYQIEGKSLPPGNATSDAIRFQQSLIFTDNGSNAPPGQRPQGRAGRDRPDGQRAEGQRGEGQRGEGQRGEGQRGEGRRGEGRRGAVPTPEAAPPPDAGKL